MFWVANLLDDGTPTIVGMHFASTEAEALDLAVKMAQEQGADDDEETIRRELADEGRYRSGKYSEWAVCMGEVQKPAPFQPSCPQFTCPACGSHRLEEIMDGCTVASEILDVGPGGDLEYGEQDNDGGVVARFQCLNCGWQVPDAEDAEALAVALGVDPKEPLQEG